MHPHLFSNSDIYFVALLKYPLPPFSSFYWRSSATAMLGGYFCLTWTCACRPLSFATSRQEEEIEEVLWMPVLLLLTIDRIHDRTAPSHTHDRTRTIAHTYGPKRDFFWGVGTDR